MHERTTPLRPLARPLSARAAKPFHVVASPACGERALVSDPLVDVVIEKIKSTQVRLKWSQPHIRPYDHATSAESAQGRMEELWLNQLATRQSPTAAGHDLELGDVRDDR